VAGFIFYLYAPHLLFKSAAEAHYDLITRKEIPQVEEFFAAGLPGVFLNVQAALLLRILPFKFSALSLRTITVDWNAVALVFQKDADLSPYVKSDDAKCLIAYMVVLGVSSWLAGSAYGRLRRRIALVGGRTTYLRWPRSNASILEFVTFVPRVTGFFYSLFWNMFYSQYLHPFYPVILRNSYAFVHTTRNLYHGIVYSADKRRDGDIEGIVLIGVSKFSRENEAELIRAGRNPITDLIGPLFIKWSEITDINYPPDGSILETKRAEYQERIAAGAAKKGGGASLDASPPSEELSPAGTVTTNG
jgi:hypothetical protein